MSKQKNLKQKPKPGVKREARKKVIDSSNTPARATFVFEKENYYLLLGGLVLIVLGFILMIGGGADSPNEFSYEIFNFQRMTLAPILILAGYAVEVYAIMRKPKAKTEKEAE